MMTKPDSNSHSQHSHDHSHHQNQKNHLDGLIQSNDHSLLSLPSSNRRSPLSSTPSFSSSKCLDYTNHQLTPQIIQSTILSASSSFDKLFPFLTSLLLSFNHIGDKGLIILLENITNSCSSLVTLDLGFNGISDVGVEILGEKLVDHPSLQILYLSGNSITDLGCSFLALFLQENHILTKLYLAGNTRITSLGAESLSQALLSNTSLIALDLNSLAIRSAGFSSISSVLKNEFMNLSELYLSNTDCQDEGVQVLANSLQYYRKLEVHNRFSFFSSDLLSGHVPQILDISFNGITQTGFGALVTSLSQYPCLRSFSISNNKLGDKSIKHLISMIQNINTLQSLSVDYNGFSPMGILALINSLSLLTCFHKPFLKLSLCGNSMNTESAKALGAFLSHANGHFLTALHLDHMSIGAQGEQQIAAAIASNQHCKLETVTGLLLGPLMTDLGSPSQLAEYSNLQVLKYVKEMWSSYNHSKIENHQQQQEQQQDTGDRNSLRRNGAAVVDYPETEADEEYQCIGRKRAASDESVDEKENQMAMTHPTNTQSEDDLTELADDVQTHIRAGAPTSAGEAAVTGTRNPSHRKENTLAETSEEAIANREQIKLIMKKLEQIFDPILSEVAALPFDPSNLWTLHQYYYSPSSPTESSVPSSPSKFDPSNQLMEIEVDQKKFYLESMTTATSALTSNGSHVTHNGGTGSRRGGHRDGDDDPDDDVSRPNKRQGNRFTMTRIAAYPRIKQRLETLKSTSESRLLTILRQLRCVEQYVDKYREKYPYFMELDVESVILDRNGY